MMKVTVSDPINNAHNIQHFLSYVALNLKFIRYNVKSSKFVFCDCYLVLGLFEVARKIRHWT